MYQMGLGMQNLLIKNQISNQIDRISDEESEKEGEAYNKHGMNKRENLAIHIITLHHTQRITVHRSLNHYVKTVLLLRIAYFNNTKSRLY